MNPRGLTPQKTPAICDYGQCIEPAETRGLCSEHLRAYGDAEIFYCSKCATFKPWAERGENLLGLASDWCAECAREFERDNKD